MLRLFRKLMISASLLALTTAAEAAGRVAFVVGNSAYETQGKLTNPGNDAEDIAVLLKKLGFEVIEGRDLNRKDFNRRKLDFVEMLEDMLAKAEPGDEPPMALFYYSGHGMQVDGINYIVPVDAKIEKPGDERRTAITLDSVIKDINGDDQNGKDQDRKGLISVVILDACRDNPFARQLARSMGLTRAAEQPAGGLAQINVAGGSLIVYATDPGKVAQDGDGRNSPFTSAFLHHAPTPGIEIMHLMTRVRADVLNATRSQRPWASTSLTDQIFLAGRGEASLHQASLTTAAPQIGRESQPRHIGPPPVTPGDVPVSKDAPKAQKSEAELAGERCDAVATDKDDALRSPKARHVMVIKPALAIPACEEAVKLNPKTLRFYNQLGRAYDIGERHNDAVRVLKISADRGSSYATASMGAYAYHGLGGMKRDHVQSRLWLEKATAMGAVRAMKYLGLLHAQGIGGPRDIGKALDYYNRAIATGDASSMAWLGNLYVQGAPGLEKDYDKARDLYQRAADLEDPEGMVGLGALAQYGWGMALDFERARKWYEKAAAYESADGKFALGELYNFGTAGVPKDQVTARQWYVSAAEQTNTAAMYRLGEFAMLGIAGDKNLDESKRWMNRAIERNYTAAMLYMADQHLEGTFGKVDREAARELLKRAAELNDEIAQTRLASFDRKESPGDACDRLASNDVDPLRNKAFKPVDQINADKVIAACLEAVAANPNELRFANQLGRGYLEQLKYDDALRVFLPAAEKKSAYAALWVGNIYGRGNGVAKDPGKARDWYEKGAAYGQRNAAYNLARMYLDGDQIPVNLEKARVLFERAVALGEPAAYTELGKMHFGLQSPMRDDRKARLYFEKGADLGDSAAMYQLGYIYEQGRGVSVDFRRGRQWYARSAEKGYVASMLALARLYLGAKGGDIETEKARGLLAQAADNNDTQAMTMLAQGYLAGTFGAADEALGRSWYQKAAKAGSTVAQRWLASVDADPAEQAEFCDKLAGDSDDPLMAIGHPPVKNVQGDQASPACEVAVKAEPEVLRYQNQLGRAYIASSRHFDALRVFRKAAEDGSAYAALWVGNIHARGLGTPVNEDEGAKWYEKAAEAGLLVAMFNLADYHFDRAVEGKDPEKHGPQAIQWFERAAGLGNADAMFMLARIYGEGKIGAARKDKHFEWLKRAETYNHPTALGDLAHMYWRGDNVPEDKELARKYAERGEKLDNRVARMVLALLMAFGEGGPEDRPMARQLLEKNAAANHGLSLYYLAKAHQAKFFGPVEPSLARELYQRSAELGINAAKAELEKMNAAKPAPSSEPAKKAPAKPAPK